MLAAGTNRRSNYLKLAKAVASITQHRVRAKLLSFLPMVFLLNCNETLPEYRKPQGLFRPSWEAHLVLGPWENVLDNSLKVYLNVLNTFDETFEAKVNIEGSLEIILVKDTSYHKTFRITDNDIYSATSYNRVTKKLTIDPGDSLRVRVSWDFVDDYGRDLQAYVFRYTPDPTCFGRRFAAPEFFILRGEMKLFDQTGYLFPPDTTYQLCHVSGWNGMCAHYPLGGECDYYRQNVIR